MASNIAIDNNRIQAMVEHMRAIAETARTTPSEHAVEAVSGINGNAGQAGVTELLPFGLKAEDIAAVQEQLGGGDRAKPVDFSQVLRQTLQQVSDAQNNSRKMSESFSMGDANINLSDVMIAMQKASISFQTTIQVRNRLVSAYRDIMTMQI